MASLLTGREVPGEQVQEGVVLVVVGVVVVDSRQTMKGIATGEVVGVVEVVGPEGDRVRALELVEVIG